MKTQHFVKKYRLSEGDQFNHKEFAIDFGHEFMARLELHQTFGNWSHNKYMELVDHMRSRWENINNKTLGNLPEKLWNFIYFNVLMPPKDDLFPDIAAQEKEIDGMDVRGLKYYLNSKLNLNDNFFKKDIINMSFMEWDNHVDDKAVGSLGIRPNRYLLLLQKEVDIANTYIIYYAYNELEYQLNKMGHAKAKIQFKIHHDYRNRSSKFDWSDFVFRNKMGIFNPDEYRPYFQILGFNEFEKLKEADVQKAYRNLSMRHHPDKGGNAEQFVEITEARNKCLEYVSVNSKDKSAV